MAAEGISRARTRVGVACALVVIAFVALWILGQEASADPTLRPSAIALALYPGTWHPVARGVAWLVAGAAAVGFDLFVMLPGTPSRRGRAVVLGFTVITGACFAAFAGGSFAGAGWSVIH